MKNLKWTVAVISIFFVLIISPFFIVPVFNNITLYNFSKQLFNIDLPDAEVIDTFSVCGKLIGNGNGIDFLSCVLINTTLSYEELLEQISETRFIPAKNSHIDKYSSIEPEIMFVDKNEIVTPYSEYERITFDSLTDVTGYDQLFVIAIFDGGYSADFDVRGH